MRPEERVRQACLCSLKEELGFPASWIAIEKQLAELPRRIDILCYHKQGEQLIPFLLIECKKNKIDQKAIDQVIGYNFYVKAPFLALVSRESNCIGWYDGKKYQFHPGLLPYRELCRIFNTVGFDLPNNTPLTASLCLGQDLS